MIRIPESDLVALLGENGEHWVQGSWSDGDAMCLHGAIRRCAPVKGDAYLIEQVANRKRWGTSWNDNKATSWADVRARLSHVEVTDDDLAVTFGPQWETIVVLVRRAALLTVDEARRFAAERNAELADAAADAWIAAFDASWEAESKTELSDALDAAADAAADAAWEAGFAQEDAAAGAAGIAAANAARALVVRDLIGQHGFTQAHYDALTGPWALVIGPVHPDDAVVKP